MGPLAVRLVHGVLGPFDDWRATASVFNISYTGQVWILTLCLFIG